MPRLHRLAGLLVVALALGASALPASAKRKPPPPPPPPPDTAGDCTAFVQPSIEDYLVLSTLNVGVQCATTKQTITVTTVFTRDGVVVPQLPYDTITCTNTSVCVGAIDLFSYDNHPVAYPGDQLYCATATGVVGGVTIAPASGCEEDARL